VALILFPLGAVIFQVQSNPSGYSEGKLGLSITPLKPLTTVLQSVTKRKKLLQLTASDKQESVIISTEQQHNDTTGLHMYA